MFDYVHLDNQILGENVTPGLKPVKKKRESMIIITDFFLSCSMFREEFLLNKQCPRINGGYVSYCVFPDEDNIKQHRRHGIVFQSFGNEH